MNAVWVHDAEKSYEGPSGKHFTVFKNLHMNVPVGKIYALLGPSGCGKTTLLRCILGRQRLNQGTVLLFGYPPGSAEIEIPGRNIGYMPQEADLIDTMTIAECMWYYATLVGLEEKKIQREIKFYLKFLRLPEKSTLTANLSGGQARRVSFAIALLHNPQLVILDEPTVGIDPILKDCMWQHILEMSNSKDITFILTTHYIEEAKKSHYVGMIHDGKMAAEDDTENLLRATGCSSLEEVFLKLCTNERVPHCSTPENASPSSEQSSDYSAISPRCPSEAQRVPIPEHLIPHTPLRELCLRKKPLKSIVVKNIYFLLRFPRAFLALLLCPIACMLSFHLSYEGPFTPLDVNVVNFDTGHLGKRYLSYLHPDVVSLKSCESFLPAHDKLLHGDTHGLIHIPQNFSEVLYKRLLDGPLATKEVLDTKTMSIFVDSSYYSLMFRVEYHLLNSFKHFLWDLTNSTVADLPIKFNDQLYDSLENPTFRLATFNVVMLSLYFNGVAGTVLLLFVELRKGFLERSFVAGATATELLFGLMLVQFSILLIQSVIQFVMFLIFFHQYIHGSLILLFFLFYATAISGSAFGIFLSLAIEQFYIIVLIGAGSLIMSGCMSAAYYPVEAMPPVFQYICKALPLLFPVQTLKNLVAHDWYITNIRVSAGFIVLIIWLAIFAMLSIRLLMIIKSSSK